MKSTKRGILIACEGIDGSGKSTLAKALFTHFSAQNIPVLLTKEPGGTEFGKQLRAMLQDASVKRCAKAEFLLFAADRAQHFQEMVIPALSKGTLVISDRLADSSLVYQGYGRGLDHAMIQEINAWAINNHKPDITIYLRVDAQTAFDRIIKRNEEKTAFEQESKDFFNRLITGFDTLYAQRPDVIIINGDASRETIAQEALEKLNHLLAMQNLESQTHD